ncbi:MAG: hypothetical protein E6I97_26510 [Chloroflexi bacterium]|nr:MAG: hypothetical protein E6I97_26510 [Chloroflexota bacterium]
MRRHLLDGDFPRNQQYTQTSGCPLQAGRRLSRVGWGTARRTHPTSTFSPLMITHVLADEGLEAMSCCRETTAG